MSASASARFPELDLLRGFAIVLMIVYHAAYDLSIYWGWDIDVFRGGWWLLARGTAILFLLVSGMSNAVACMRRRGRGLHWMQTWQKSVPRALQILAGALLVMAVTFIVDPETYVRFGILHLLGVGALLLPLLAPFKEWNALLGIAMIVVGQWMVTLRASTSLLLPFGVMPRGFQTVDYFPLLPWFGVILIGFAIGYLLYGRRRSGPLLHKESTLLIFPARHGLLIYLLHQPILITTLTIILGRPA